MDLDFEQITREALSLPASSRATLAEKLLESLDEPAGDAIEDLWVQEAERRGQELDDGTVQPLSGEEVLRRVRDRAR